MKGASKPKAHGAKARKERDEDLLLLFREMFKREKERNVASLLDPVSSEFESSQGEEYIKLNFVCCSTTKFVSWEIIRFKTSNCNKYYYFDY